MLKNVILIFDFGVGTYTTFATNNYKGVRTGGGAEGIIAPPYLQTCIVKQLGASAMCTPSSVQLPPKVRII